MFPVQNYVDVNTPVHFEMHLKSQGNFESTRTLKPYAENSDAHFIALSKDQEKGLLKTIRNTFGLTYQIVPSWVAGLWEKWAKEKLAQMPPAEQEGREWFHFRFEEVVDISFRRSKLGIQELRVHQRVGHITVHHGVLNPIRLDPLALKVKVSQLLNFLEAVEKGKARAPKEGWDRILYRWAMHPNWAVRTLRQTVDVPMFFLLNAAIVAYDLLIERHQLKSYPFYRKGILGIWLFYLLVESNAYTQVSDWYSKTMSMEEGLDRFLFENEWMTDSYAWEEVNQFENDGQTLIWVAFQNDRFYHPMWADSFVEVQKSKFKGWNTTYVVLGEPQNSEYWESYDLVRNGAVAAKIWVDWDDRMIRYQTLSDPQNPLSEQDVTHVFKAITWISNQVACRHPGNACKITNVLLHSHGSPGGGNLVGILNFSNVLEDTEFYLRGSGEGGLANQHVKLDVPAFQNMVGDNPLMVLLACFFAQSQQGKIAMQHLADLFGVEAKKGRIVASTKTIVVPLLMIPMFRLQAQGEQREQINHWSLGDILKGYFMFGPHVIHRYLNQGSYSNPNSVEEPVYALDYQQ
jgi:hypothetical protein